MFTANERRADPVSKLREDLEQLDIKFLTDYDKACTHVVSKKRNVAKGLQALVNGQFIVTDAFYGAIINAATPEDGNDGMTASALESDFDANWPDAMQFVPPPGDEAVPRPVEAFAPNPSRSEIFHGFSFIFYNRKQFDQLLGPITNGGGKALLNEVVEGETVIDDFIRYVKGVAGEKGLGEFEDGSEGKGVVVVRWIPSPPKDAVWFTEFYTSVSLRLDHRLIDQKEFLDAILNNDASGLRRPLEAEADPYTPQVEPQPPTVKETMDIDEHHVQPQQPPPRRRVRGTVKSRFKGFNVDLEDDDLPVDSPAPVVPQAAEAEFSQEALFVSQDAASQEPNEDIHNTRQSQRKRRIPPLPEPQNIMDDFAPTAAQVKRRRIAAGEDPVPRRPAPSTAEPRKPSIKAPKVKKEIDILELARQHREEAEAQAKAEREELAMAPEDLDLAEIRRLHIEEPMELRQMPLIRTREQDIADGRWDPAWNGRKNFKKFRQRNGVQGRAPQKIIVSLEEVKSKGFGIGDDYWLEDDSQQQKRKKQTQSQTPGTDGRADQTESNGHAKGPRKQTQRLPSEILPQVDSSEDEDHRMDDDEDENADVVIAPASKTRASRASQQTAPSQLSRTTTRSTSQKTQSSRTSKRPAPPLTKEQPTKRSRLGLVAASDDESDDELRFRFGKR